MDKILAMGKLRIFITLLSGVILWLGVSELSAQSHTLSSSYFLKGATFRHDLNPAFMGERNYVSFPGLGNLGMGVQTTAGVGNFLFPSATGGLTTFMSAEVRADEFLNKLPYHTKMAFKLDETLFSTGFYAWGGFNTLGISLKSHTAMALPKELFHFMKKGVDSPLGSMYQVDNIDVYSNNYAEVTLGHARKINDQWTVGAKMKLLVGLANAQMHIDRLDIIAGQDEWKVTPTGAELFTSVKGLNVPTKGETGNYENSDYEKGPEGEKGELKPGVNQHISYDDITFDGPKGPTGYGLAFDFGATYKLNDSWNFSASILDLGFISWNNMVKGNMNQAFVFDGFANIPVEAGGESNSLSDQVDELTDDLKALAQFSKVGQDLSRTSMLAATLNFAAEYTLPVYDRLTFGLLSTTRVQGRYSWSEARMSANIAPVSWFEASANYAVSNFGSTAGLLLNFHPRGFNFFMGVDVPLGKLSKTYTLPLNRGMMNVGLGINFTFGDAHH